MPRKLKTSQTSLGFFHLALAAPSMKAALEAWGSKANLFHQGFAEETGVVLEPHPATRTYQEPRSRL
jgi:hypothetical protein